jgi:hypothetical protein
LQLLSIKSVAQRLKYLIPIGNIYFCHGFEIG